MYSARPKECSRTNRSAISVFLVSMVSMIWRWSIIERLARFRSVIVRARIARLCTNNVSAICFSSRLLLNEMICWWNWMLVCGWRRDFQQGYAHLAWEVYCRCRCPSKWWRSFRPTVVSSGCSLIPAVVICSRLYCLLFWHTVYQNKFWVSTQCFNFWRS